LNPPLGGSGPGKAGMEGWEKETSAGLATGRGRGAGGGAGWSAWTFRKGSAFDEARRVGASIWLADESANENLGSIGVRFAPPAPLATVLGLELELDDWGVELEAAGGVNPGGGGAVGSLGPGVVDVLAHVAEAAGPPPEGGSTVPLFLPERIATPPLGL
jgi:hypothetical protein